ncbi:MAG TPA: hypothetical protein VLG16_05275 [Candidatus Saccharimonadales bacterium]|nr:hypothetical protein [Candidatus Saccharimonadales bacterium]
MGNLEQTRNLLTAIDGVREANTGNCLSSPFFYSAPESSQEYMGTLTICIGRKALQYVPGGEFDTLRVGFIDTQIPDLGMRAAFLALIDETRNRQNAQPPKMYDINPQLGTHRLMPNGQMPVEASPTETVTIEELLYQADFRDPQPLDILQTRIEEGAYPQTAQYVHAVADPRPLFL